MAVLMAPTENSALRCRTVALHGHWRLRFVQCHKVLVGRTVFTEYENPSLLTSRGFCLVVPVLTTLNVAGTLGTEITL